MPYEIVGIINCTPDSFSDGDPLISVDDLCNRASSMLDHGATILDIGGDSTRPGSQCVNDTEEWQRIAPVLKRFASRVPISVDTHKAEIARRAIDSGAAIINDAGDGSDPEIVNIVANSTARYVCMFSASGTPHSFESKLATTHQITPETIIDTLSTWASIRSAELNAKGIGLDRQIFDTGLGGFLSPNSDVSYRVIERYWNVLFPAKYRMFGCSRKGFLKQPGELSINERDTLSSFYGAQLAISAPADCTIYLRVHNVAEQARALR